MGIPYQHTHYSLIQHAMQGEVQASQPTPRLSALRNKKTHPRASAEMGSGAKP